MPVNVAKNKLTFLPDSLAMQTRLTEIFVFSNQIQYLPATKHAKERGELEAKGPSALVTQTAKDEAEARAEAKRIVMERLHSAETQRPLQSAQKGDKSCESEKLRS